MVQTFQEAIDEIFSFELKKDYSLDTMRLAMRLLENPLDNIQLIHIAGTNGKGSVSQMMFSILQHA
jgi:dihydrofolate synthase/folylpolyglutamate synthase